MQGHGEGDESFIYDLISQEVVHGKDFIGNILSMLLIECVGSQGMRREK